MNDAAERIRAQVNRSDRLARGGVFLAEWQERGKPVAASGLRRGGLAFLALATESFDPADDCADAIVCRNGFGQRRGGIGQERRGGFRFGQRSGLDFRAVVFDCVRRLRLGQEEIVDAEAREQLANRLPQIGAMAYEATCLHRQARDHGEPVLVGQPRGRYCGGCGAGAALGKMVNQDGRAVRG
ncbi:hypothetical protein C7W88_10185 [Novosphingobium sp. THN1]|uniref:hypothetical protein n=1 Tax=Novosphingobium sp. THN1 TaxID=1016987 RepID=UPI000E499D4D|nr:hypothetical protein [Novosphingobium sp. THN1]AXU19319.1 hypothetical protein C7W88_10185 [Novosphingobium sp. THN1]